MRATLGRVAVVLLLVLSVCGCKSGPSMFASGKKKQDSLTDAPKYAGPGAGSPTLPSSAVNPSASLANMPAPGGVTAAGSGVTAAGSTAYGATPAAYQNSYPKTPYEQAKVGGAQTASASGAASANPQAAANGSGAATGTSNYAATAATTPAYGVAPNATTMPVQPQNGFYTTPGYNAAAAQTPNSYAAAPPAAAASAPPPADPNAMMAAYRTADARGATPAMTQGADPNAMQANAGAGDRYAAPPAAMGGDRYADPATSAQAAGVPAASAATNGYGDRYSQPPMNYRSDNSVPGNNGYQPGVTPNPPGNTGYNPSDAYSTSGAALGGAGTLPARQDPNYRPGGTGDYTVPAGATLPANSGVQPSGHVSFGGVTPASYQAPVSASAASGESYGAYQGASSSSEPAYGASNPYAATPGLFPAR